MVDSATEAIDPMLMRAKARVGRTLRGKWHLDVLLGVGGMAAVYAATHRNGTRAAIKLLHTELGLHADVRSRFFREGRVANTVQHPGAVSVLDEDEDDGAVFLVMELLDGEMIEGRAARCGGLLPIDEVLALVDQVLDVLVAAHDKGVVHRDLKPENLFLTRTGEVKLLDFGIARLRELSTASTATRDGSTMGTPAFMAPEQARGLWDEVDGRTDLWAVGATMFTLLSGSPVHAGRTTNEVLIAAATAPAQPLRSAVPDLAEPVAALVDRALAFDKSARWPDAASMQQELRRAYHNLQGVPLSTHPRLTVPADVPDRTLPSVGVDPIAPTQGTEAAVSSGKSGIPLRSSAESKTPLGAWIAGGLVLFGFVVATVIIAASLANVGLRGHATPAVGPSAPRSATASAPHAATTGAPISDVNVGEPDAGASGVAVDGPRKITPAAAAPKPRAPPPTKTPTSAPAPTNWKDQRK